MTNFETAFGFQQPTIQLPLPVPHLSTVPVPIFYDWRLFDSVADPGSWIRCFLPPGSGIRDGAMVGSGSGIRDKQTKFVNSLYTKIGRIRDPVLFYPPDPGSGMEQ
jgi:hypothetical protein